MSADREAELARQVEDLTGLVVDLLTREPLDDEPPEPDPEYDVAVDRTNVLRPLLVEAHRVIADREGGRYGSDELGMCLHWIDAGMPGRVSNLPRREQAEVVPDACERGREVPDDTALAPRRVRRSVPRQSSRDGEG